MATDSQTKSPELTRVYAWFSALVGDDLKRMDDLLAHGVPVDVPHPLRHTTALMEATRLGRTATVHWLLARGAAPAFLCGLPQGSPLHCALRLHHWEIAALLTHAVPTAATIDEFGRTPLHVLATESSACEDIGCIIKIAHKLGKKHCPLDALDHEGVTALHYAVLNDDGPLTEMLLALGANPNCAVPDTGMTPLGIAALDKNMNLVATLVLYGANPHQRFHDGATPATILPAITRMVSGVPPHHRQSLALASAQQRLRLIH